MLPTSPSDAVRLSQSVREARRTAYKCREFGKHGQGLECKMAAICQLVNMRLRLKVLFKTNTETVRQTQRIEPIQVSIQVLCYYSLAFQLLRRQASKRRLVWPDHARQCDAHCLQRRCHATCWPPEKRPVTHNDYAQPNKLLNQHDHDAS